MGRHKQFVKEDALDAAIDVFCRRGFEGTGIQDLVDGLGLNRSSIYAEFGSKQGLFDQAVAHYMKESVSQKIIDAPRDEPILSLLQRVLEPIIENAVSGEGRSGCLVIAAVTTSDDPESQFMRQTRANILQFEANLYARLLIAQERGEIASDSDAMALARGFINGLHGLRVTCKLRPEPDVLRDIVNQLLSQVAGQRIEWPLPVAHDDSTRLHSFQA